MSTATPIRVMLVLIAAYSIVILFSFVKSLEKFRGRLEWIYKKYFECEEREALGLALRKGLFNRVGFRCWPCSGFSSRVSSSPLSPCGPISIMQGQDITG